MGQTFVFIYLKGSEITVLNLDSSRMQHAILIENGWKHTATLDACKWIQNLYNNCHNFKKEVQSLTKINS